MLMLSMPRTLLALPLKLMMMLKLDLTLLMLPLPLPKKPLRRLMPRLAQLEDNSMSLKTLSEVLNSTTIKPLTTSMLLKLQRKLLIRHWQLQLLKEHHQ
jgi:hypothetical protein